MSGHREWACVAVCTVSAAAMRAVNTLTRMMSAEQHLSPTDDLGADDTSEQHEAQLKETSPLGATHRTRCLRTKTHGVLACGTRLNFDLIQQLDFRKAPLPVPIYAPKLPNDVSICIRQRVQCGQHWWGDSDTVSSGGQRASKGVLSLLLCVAECCMVLLLGEWPCKPWLVKRNVSCDRSAFWVESIRTLLGAFKRRDQWQRPS